MARINIDIGALGNPATGDTLRTAMTKINTNFTEVYSLVRDGSSGLIATDVTNGDLKLQANGTGAIEIDTLSITNSTITSITTNSDITLTPNGTGNVVLGNFTFNADQTVGAGQDNYVFTYDHSTGTIGLEAAASGGVSASSTTTFTNKTFDANGTGNSISNIDIADFTSGVFLDEDNMASNSATAIASQQSIKAYVDSQILTKDNTDEITEGSTNLYFTNARADARITNALKDEDNMASDSATHVPSQQSVKAYVDAEDANIASDSMTFTNKAGNISQWTNDSNYATQAYVDARDIGDLSVVGSTISAPSNADLTLTTSGTGSVSIDGIQISGTEISSSDSTQVTIKENLHVTGNISGTITGTVATIDADSTTVSNLEVDNFKAATIVIESEGIGSNDNDTTIPTSAAVKDYVDNNATTSLAADNLTIGDAAVTITTTTGDITLDTQGNNRDIIFKGTDGGVDITPLQIDMSEGGKAIFQADIQGQGVTISDNTITSNRSNDDLIINAAGSGTVILESLYVGTNPGATVTTILDEDNMSTNSATALATQQSIKAYVDSEISGVSGGSTGDLTITGSTISAPSNADLTLNAGGTGSVDIDGIQIKGTSISSTDSTQININENVSIDGTLSVGGASLSGTLNTAGNTGTGSVALASESLQVTGTTNEINIEAAAFALTASLADNISGIVSVTASSFLANDAIKIIDNKITGTRSNENVELEANGTGGVIAQSPFTFNAGYIEKINTLTSSSTITVDCSAASIHKVTLGTSTEFNISNLPTGGTVTLIITQDGSGSRTATFGTDGSTAVKFPGGAPTLSTGAGDIDVVTIINDGTNFLGNCAKDYS